MKTIRNILLVAVVAVISCSFTVNSITENKNHIDGSSITTNEAATIVQRLTGTWDAYAEANGGKFAITTLVFNGTSGYMFTQGPTRQAFDGRIRATATSNGNYNIYLDNAFVATYTKSGQLRDKNGQVMKRVSSSTMYPVIITYYMSNTYCTMGDYGIKNQYVYKTLIEHREYDNHGVNTFKIIERGTNRVVHQYKCGNPRQGGTDRVRQTVSIIFSGKDTSDGSPVKVTSAVDYSGNGNYDFYITTSDGECRMYNSTLCCFNINVRNH